MTATSMSDTETSAGVLTTSLRAMFAQMHAWLEGTLGDVSAEQAHWQPGGRVVPAGAHYAHHPMGAEDLLFNTLIRGATPLAMGEWARQVAIDVPAVRAYARAVYDNTDAYLATVTMEEWNRLLDMSVLGVEGQ